MVRQVRRATLPQTAWHAHGLRERGAAHGPGAVGWVVGGGCCQAECHCSSAVRLS